MPACSSSGRSPGACSPTRLRARSHVARRRQRRPCRWRARSSAAAARTPSPRPARDARLDGASPPRVRRDSPPPILCQTSAACARVARRSVLAHARRARRVPGRAALGRRVGSHDRARARRVARGEAGGHAAAAARRRRHPRRQLRAQAPLGREGRPPGGGVRRADHHARHLGRGRRRPQRDRLGSDGRRSDHVRRGARGARRVRRPRACSRAMPSTWLERGAAGEVPETPEARRPRRWRDPAST